MKQVSFNLPKDNNVIKKLPVGGIYKVTVTGLADTNARVWVSSRNQADDGWDAAVDFMHNDSGIIGSAGIGVNDNGLLKMELLSATGNTYNCKVTVSA